MGSDGWPDLNFMWAGKNRSMKWRLAGERTILTPFTKTTKDILEEEPDGTITRKIPSMKWGFRVKGWKGASWAPVDMTFVPRPVWVIEQMPKDPYYNWGLHINYVDKETYVIWEKEVFDKAGQFRSWHPIATHYEEAQSGNNNVGVLDGYWHIDEKSRHCTLIWRQPVRDYELLFGPQSRLGPDYYTLSNFLQMSK